MNLYIHFSFTSFVFAVVNENSGIIHRLKVSVEGNVRMSYVFKESNAAYERIVNNYDVNEMKFTEGTEGEILYSIIEKDSTARKLGNRILSNIK